MVFSKCCWTWKENMQFNFGKHLYILKSLVFTSLSYLCIVISTCLVLLLGLPFFLVMFLIYVLKILRQIMSFFFICKDPISWKMWLYYPVLIQNPHIILSHNFTFLQDLPCFWRDICVGTRKLYDNEISHKRVDHFSELVELFWLNYLPSDSPTLCACPDFCWSHLTLCKLCLVFVLGRMCWVAGPWWALGSCSSDHRTSWLTEMSRKSCSSPASAGKRIGKACCWEKCLS